MGLESRVRDVVRRVDYRIPELAILFAAIMFVDLAGKAAGFWSAPTWIVAAQGAASSLLAIGAALELRARRE